MEEHAYSRASDVYFNPEREGYLVEKKQFTRNVRTWCSLQGPTLYLQKNQSGVMQVIDMADVQNVKPLADFQFDVCLKKSKYTFICSSREEWDSWVCALLKAMASASTKTTNGCGRSVFDDPCPEQADDNPYSMPVDVVTTKVSGPAESVYEEVTSAQVGASSNLSARDSGQKVNNVTQSRPHEKTPPLPPMNSRNRSQLQQQQQNDCEYTDAYSQGAEYGDSSYTDALSLSDDSNTNPSRGSEVPAKRENAQKEICQESSQIQEVGDSYGDIQSEHDASGSDSFDSTPVLRRQVSHFEEGDLASESPPGLSDATEPDTEDVQEIDDAFSDLDKALTLQDTSDLVLDRPLVAEDYQQVKQLKDILANNKNILPDSSHLFVLLDPNEDPVLELKQLLAKVTM